MTTKLPEMELPASKLSDCLNEIRISGGFVAGLNCTNRNGVYRLRIHWPSPEQQPLAFIPVNQKTSTAL